MEKLVVHGGCTLRGAVNISGSKNASLPILAASLLTDEPVVIRRVPDVSDTNYMIQILGQLGADVERSSGNVRIHAANIHSSATYEQVRKMRASICLLGPILARKHECHIPLPGGCVIGDRPVDLHIRAVEALGAHVKIEEGNLIISAPNGLKGTTVDLRGDNGPTVLG
ncbi:MAG: UDP-N-acetylglucosamine 1-carboxyvinyltransferase, partial [Akkermansia sp.]